MTAPDAWPTEDLATRAVDAAARYAYEQWSMKRDDLPPGAVMPPYDDLDALMRLDIRQQVLPIVWAALTDLPDPRYAAWVEGYSAGSSDGAFEASGSGNIPGLVYPHENPYPSGL